MRVGLTNLGNTCYINSILQSLSSCPSFVCCLLQHQESFQTDPISKETVNCILELANPSRNGTLRPTALVHAIRARFKMLGYDQNDAHELLLLLLDALFDKKNFQVKSNGILDLWEVTKPQRRSHNSLTIPVQLIQCGILSAGFGLDSGLDKTELIRSCVDGDGGGQPPQAAPPDYNIHPFKGITTSTLLCPKCGYRPTSILENCVDVTVPIAEIPQYMGVSLKECLEKWGSFEVVEGAKCERCVAVKDLKEAKKKQKELEEGATRLIQSDIMKHAIEASLDKEVGKLSEQLMKMGYKEEETAEILGREEEESKGAAAINLATLATTTCMIKQHRFLRPPKILCIHLRRLVATMFAIKKVETPVVFPMQFDLHFLSAIAPKTSLFCQYQHENGAVGGDGSGSSSSSGGSSGWEYRLVALVQHCGSASFGHYVAYCRQSTGEWIRISDNKITQVSQLDLLTAQPYLLFYEQIHQ